MRVFVTAISNTVLVLALLAPGDLESFREERMLNDQQISSLASRKILFGHQSVGTNILNGIRDMAATDARLKLNIVKSSHPESISGPAIVEFNVGENGNPQSKINAFNTVLEGGMG